MNVSSRQLPPSDNKRSKISKRCLTDPVRSWASFSFGYPPTLAMKFDKNPMKQKGNPPGLRRENVCIFLWMFPGWFLSVALSLWRFYMLGDGQKIMERDKWWKSPLGWEREIQARQLKMSMLFFWDYPNFLCSSHDGHSVNIKQDGEGLMNSTFILPSADQCHQRIPQDLTHSTF